MPTIADIQTYDYWMRTYARMARDIPTRVIPANLATIGECEAYRRGFIIRNMEAQGFTIGDTTAGEALDFARNL